MNHNEPGHQFHPVRRIIVRSRKHPIVPERSRDVHEEMSTTSCSPVYSPRKLRIVQGSEQVRPRLGSDTNFSEDSTVCSMSSPSHSRQLSLQLEQFIRAVTHQLWMRDGPPTQPQLNPFYDTTLATALWYVNLYLSSLIRAIDEQYEIAVALAAIFISFKAADHIPGIGRIKMNQLLAAYAQTTLVDVSEIESSRLVEEICRAEMEILCLSGFNFSPC